MINRRLRRIILLVCIDIVLLLLTDDLNFRGIETDALIQVVIGLIATQLKNDSNKDESKKEDET